MSQAESANHREVDQAAEAAARLFAGHVAAAEKLIAAIAAAAERDLAGGSARAEASLEARAEEAERRIDERLSAAERELAAIASAAEREFGRRPEPEPRHPSTDTPSDAEASDASDGRGGEFGDRLTATRAQLELRRRIAAADVRLDHARTRLADASDREVASVRTEVARGAAALGSDAPGAALRQACDEIELLLLERARELEAELERALTAHREELEAERTRLGAMVADPGAGRGLDQPRTSHEDRIAAVADAAEADAAAAVRRVEEHGRHASEAVAEAIRTIRRLEVWKSSASGPTDGWRHTRRALGLDVSRPG